MRTEQIRFVLALACTLGAGSLEVPGLPLVNMEGREYALEVAFCSPELSMAGNLGEMVGKCPAW
jgi:hypothetical protein